VVVGGAKGIGLATTTATLPVIPAIFRPSIRDG
jgi:hypothetical protein